MTERAKAIRRVEAGDVLVVTRLDRLARSTRDLLNILDAVGKAGAGFKSLKGTWADTTTPHARLMLTVLGGLAEFERELTAASERRPVFVSIRESERYAGRSNAKPMMRVVSGPNL